MSEIPILEIGAGGAFALLVIKEFRHWTATALAKKNGGNQSVGSSTVLRKHGERIASNETDIGNIKEGLKDMKDENTREHKEIKDLIINGGK